MILHGDCLDKLKTLGDNSVDSIVTDPPYGLSFMGKKWDYDVPSIDIWKECIRVLKPGGHLLAFGGTRTYHRLVVNIEDAGFEIRDQIQWLYGSGFPKSHNIKEGDFKGWGSALKPANEPICVARKPLEKGLTLAQNVVKWRTGALNIDASRIEGKLGGDPNRFAKTDGGWGVAKFHDQPVVRNEGRWPANILFDETAAEMLDAQSGTIKSGKPGIRTQGNNGAAYGAESRPPGTLMSGFGDSGGASRFFYVAKASKRERNAGLEGMPLKESGGMSGTKDKSLKTGSGNERDNLNQNHHPTVKPIKLMEYLCKLITPPQGVVLDPFMGSGTTGVACKNLSFDFIGIEMSDEYFKIAEKRIEAVS